MNNYIVVYVAAEDVDEALMVCQSPSCRDKRQLKHLLQRLHRAKMPKMEGWKLTITAERLKPSPSIP